MISLGGGGGGSSRLEWYSAALLQDCVGGVVHCVSLLSGGDSVHLFHLGPGGPGGVCVHLSGA